MDKDEIKSVKYDLENIKRMIEALLKYIERVCK
jgi:hypothetical protein